MKQNTSECRSDKEHHGVALRHIDGIGTEGLELCLLLLQILEIDRDALAGVASFDVVQAIFIVNMCTSSHDVCGVLMLLGVDNGVGFRILATHFLCFVVSKILIITNL